MKRFFQVSVVVLACLFYVTASWSEGFLAGTLVNTPSGYKPIEQLQVDDSIVSHDLKQTQHSVITQLAYGYTTSFVELQINNNEAIQVAPSHTFYLPQEGKWKEAIDLKEGTQLLSLASAPAWITGVKLVPESASVYTVSVRDYQTFFVSRHNILVHNWTVVIPFLAKFGLGAIEICWKKMGQTFLASLFFAAANDMCYKSARRAAQQRVEEHQRLMRTDEQYRKTVEAAESYGKKDDKFPKCRYHTNCPGIHPYGLYEDAPYHHQNSRGKKSPAPINGQAALDTSVFLAKNDKGKERRIGLSCSQIVILDQTAPGLFHGHVRIWDGLDHNMKSKLHESGWAQYKTGKISWPSWAT